MVAYLAQSLRSRILESLSKHSTVFATMKHYKNIFLMKEFLNKVLSLYFDETNIYLFQTNSTIICKKMLEELHKLRKSWNHKRNITKICNKKLHYNYL